MLKRIELVQTAKVGLSEVKNRAAQFGYSVAYCIFDKCPIAILHNGSVVDGSQLGVTQNFKNIDGELRLCLGDGDTIKWSRFKYKEINTNKYNEYNLYVVR